MMQRFKATSLRPSLFALVLAMALSIDVPAPAADAATEATRLTALVRQLDVLERIAQQSAELSANSGGRYHFDYARLQADIERIRSGIQNYLTPLRAQPRDAQALQGDYRQDQDAAQ